MNPLVFAVVFIAVASASKFPKTWKKCGDDPQMNTCLEKAIEEAIRSLQSGMPSLGILPMDPLHFDEVNIDQGQGSVAINLHFKNLDIYGLKMIHVEKVKFDMDKHDIRFTISIPEDLIVKSNYTTKGKVIILPIQGEGKCSLVFENFKCPVILKGKNVDKNGAKYFHVDSLEMDMQTTKLTMDFQNLFRGDKVMGDHMNMFLNENWSDIFKELKPAISAAFGKGFADIANRIFSKIPISEIMTNQH